MNKRINTIEYNLNIIISSEYKDFIIKYGLISDNFEVYGYIENIDIDKIPCVIGATYLYKETYKKISSNEIVIAFDDYLNSPIILNTDNNNIYCIKDNNKVLIETSFNLWLQKYKDTNE